MIYEFRGLELDTDTFELRAAGTARKLEPQVFDVLALLVAHRDRVVTKDELLDRVWGDRFVSESALTSRVKDARRAVDDDGRRQEVIRTVHGRGYRFVARVEERAGEATAPSGPAARAAGITTPPRTRYARSGTYSIAYQVVGDGPANLVFIPGYVSNVELQWEHEAMASFFSRLASFSRLVVFDKRGTGLSDRVPVSEIPTLDPGRGPRRARRPGPPHLCRPGAGATHRGGVRDRIGPGAGDGSVAHDRRVREHPRRCRGGGLR